MTNGAARALRRGTKAERLRHAHRARRGQRGIRARMKILLRPNGELVPRRRSPAMAHRGLAVDRADIANIVLRRDSRGGMKIFRRRNDPGERNQSEREKMIQHIPPGFVVGQPRFRSCL